MIKVVELTDSDKPSPSKHYSGPRPRNTAEEDSDPANTWKVIRNKRNADGGLQVRLRKMEVTA